MAHLAIELTNRCNLRCRHCFEECHAATGDLLSAIIEKALRDGKCGSVDHLAFTGGEPSIHCQFDEIMGRVCETRYTFGMVSRGVRSGFLMQSPDAAHGGLDLSPQERLAMEAEIQSLQQCAPMFVGMAPGYYSNKPFFPCGPLELQEYNLDYRGNLTLCCQLSGYAGGTLETEGLTLEEISQQLQAVFAVEPPRADRSVLSLVDELLQYQLVQRLHR